MNEPIVLGAIVKDRLSGFTGKLVSKTYYLIGEPQLGVLAFLKEDGKYPETLFFDECRLIEIK